MASYITRSNFRWLARKHLARTASIICGVLFLTPLATNFAFAEDAKVVANKILGEAIPTLQNAMVSISEGCSGGPHGQPPVSWGAIQVPGNAAVSAFSDARQYLVAAGQESAAKQQINFGLDKLDEMVDHLHLSCSGGAHGKDPVSYGAYVDFKKKLRTELMTAMRFF